MPLQLIRNDITLMHVDAIVNAANKKLCGGSGVNGAIHRAAGPELLQECLTLGGCHTGEAKITRGYQLPCRYVIHTVGPVWRGGLFGEKEKLASCYWNSLELAYRYGCRSIAFPLISSGVFGYPKDQALKVAMDTISAYLLKCDEDLDVYLIIFSKDAMQTGSKLFANIQQYIDDNYVTEHVDERCENIRACQAEEEWNSVSSFEDTMEFPPVHSSAVFEEASCWRASAPSAPCSLEDALDMIDESFSEMVLRKIKEKGMKNADCYKKANLDKKHFSKLANDLHYKPRKTTAVALAIALELDLNETKELLMKAGFALSKSDKFDIIVEYFIKEGKYNIFEINEALFYYDQTPLGNVVG
ncbi:MAG: macro domain-containing protein [Clostridia bacterium]|nr:macro domain-containing protein [Clostridia bacterium]